MGIKKWKDYKVNENIDTYKSSLLKLENEIDSMWNNISNISILESKDFDYDSKLDTIHNFTMLNHKLYDEAYKNVDDEDLSNEIDDKSSNISNKIELLEDLLKNMKKLFYDEYNEKYHNIDIFRDNTMFRKLN